MSHATTPYCYKDLWAGPDNIRLLRILPSENENSIIQCQLFNYSLQELGRRAHPYEALSYVWGESGKTLPIRVDKFDLSVTPNLHEALTRLRHRYVERIMWVDAVCINQANRKEKEQQIQFMAKIYSQANCVVVWLGEPADNSDQALEEIRIAGSKMSTYSSRTEATKRAVLALLQRQWFQRIWVLQEVGAARHVIITCGSTEIDGYAFCLGVESLMELHDAQPDLQNFIRSVTYLIRGAIFRPKGLVRGSQDICPLGELIDMYHTHKATLRSDKVYALLGMSSDNISKANLWPDYNVLWKDLFETLIKFLLYKEVFVEASPHKEIAVIKSKGCLLGKVSSVQSDSDRNGRQGVDVVSRNISCTPGYEGEWSSHWSLQPSAKSIMIGDVICHLEGASKPTIIRVWEDYWAIIVIAATPPQTIRTGGEPVSWSKFSQWAKLRTRSLLFVWDWENSLEKLQGQGKHKAPESYSDKLIRLWNSALALGDAEEYEKAEKKFQEAMEVYEIERGKECMHDTFADQLFFANSADLDLINRQYGRPLLSWAAEKGHKAVVELLLRTHKFNVNLKDKNGRTPLSWAAMGGSLAVVERLLQEGAKVNAAAAESKDKTALQAAARGGHLTVVERLLQEKAEVNEGAAWVGRTALQAAAEGGHFAVVERLLQEGAKVNAAAAESEGRTALQAAAEEGHFTIVERLLEKGAEVNAPAAKIQGRTALQAAAEGGHLKIVERLLQDGAEINAAAEFKGKTALRAAAEGGHLAVVERLLQEGAEANTAVAWDGVTALQAAVKGGHLKIVERLQQSGAVK